jgi:hypothetical protein
VVARARLLARGHLCGPTIGAQLLFETDVVYASRTYSPEAHLMHRIGWLRAAVLGANGERRTVLETARQPILAELAHIQPLQSFGAPDMSLSHLALLVNDDLVSKRPEDLIAAIVPNIVPAEWPVDMRSPVVLPTCC